MPHVWANLPPGTHNKNTTKHAVFFDKFDKQNFKMDGKKKKIFWKKDFLRKENNQFDSAK